MPSTSIAIMDVQKIAGISLPRAGPDRIRYLLCGGTSKAEIKKAKIADHNIGHGQDAIAIIAQRAHEYWNGDQAQDKRCGLSCNVQECISRRPPSGSIARAARRMTFR